MLLFFHFWENGHKQHFFGAPKDFAPPFFSPLFGERKESPPRQKKRAALHFRLTPKAPYPLAPSSFPNCDRCAGLPCGSKLRKEREFPKPGGRLCPPGSRQRWFRRSLRRNPSAVRADRVVRPYKKSVVVRIAGDSERREQSETLFRIVVTIATDG